MFCIIDAVVNLGLQWPAELSVGSMSSRQGCILICCLCSLALHSSSLRHPGKLQFVFNVVEFPACSWWPAGRRGLCTGWLYDLVDPMLVHHGKADSSSVLEAPKVRTALQAPVLFDPQVWQGCI